MHRATKCARCATRVGLIDVSTLGKIEILGPDAGAFLDRIYAGSFADLRVGPTRYGLLLDEAASCVTTASSRGSASSTYYFTTTTGGAATVYRELLLWNARWRMDCAFVNATGHRAAFNLAGPASREILQPLTDVDLSEAAFPVPRRARGQRRRHARAGHARRVRRVAGIRDPRALRRRRAALGCAHEAGARPGIRAFGVEAQRVLRLEKGHAIVGRTPTRSPIRSKPALGWAVRMDKPFFVGQRSLRIHEKRGARQQLVGFELEHADTRRCSKRTC